MSLKFRSIAVLFLAVAVVGCTPSQRRATQPPPISTTLPIPTSQAATATLKPAQIVDLEQQATGRVNLTESYFIVSSATLQKEEYFTYRLIDLASYSYTAGAPSWFDEALGSDVNGIYIPNSTYVAYTATGGDANKLAEADITMVLSLADGRFVEIRFHRDQTLGSCQVLGLDLAPEGFVVLYSNAYGQKQMMTYDISGLAPTLIGIGVYDRQTVYSTVVSSKTKWIFDSYPEMVQIWDENNKKIAEVYPCEDLK